MDSLSQSVVNKKRVLLFGDSHLSTLKTGFEEAKSKYPERCKSVEIDMIPLGAGNYLRQPFFEFSGSVVKIKNEVLRKNLPQLPLNESYNYYGFSGCLHTTRVIRDVSWWTHAPCEVAQNEIPISNSLLLEIFREDQMYQLAFIDALRSLGLSIFVIEAPKPFRHNPVFQQAREEVLLFVERMYRTFIADELKKRSIPIVSLPAASYDSSGFMLDDYRNENSCDTHHANTSFGVLMMDAVINSVRVGF